MFRPRFVSALTFTVIFLGLSFGAMAETYVSDKDDAVRRKGIAYNIAEDRKIENIGGVYEPEGLDKYLKRYIDKLSEKVDGLSSKIEKLSDQVARMSAQMDSSAAKKDVSASSAQSKLV